MESEKNKKGCGCSEEVEKAEKELTWKEHLPTIVNVVVIIASTITIIINSITLATIIKQREG